MKKRRISLIILLLLLSAVCLVSIGMAWKEYADRASDRHAFEQLAELVEQPKETDEPAAKTTDVVTDTTDTAEETTDTQTEPEPTEQKRNLVPILEQNSDCIGWICIEGTAVDYPVMHTPSDPQKYLRKNFEKKYSVSGIPFLDYRCSPDSTNLIIYGHNMDNGTMFSDLMKYLDKSFREQHPVIELETADGVRYFTVTAVIKTDIYDKRYEDIECTDGRQLLILSTCYGSAKSGRLLVIAEET